MDLVIAHPAFQQQRLSIRPAGLFRSAGLLLNGVAVKRVKCKYSAEDDGGTEVVIRLKANIFDALPVVRVGDDTVRLAAPLRWYEYVWIGIPILLIFGGGAAGGGIGAFAAFSSSRIFRGARSVGSRYLLTGLVSLGAFVIFFLVTVAIRLILNNPKLYPS